MCVKSLLCSVGGIFLYFDEHNGNSWSMWYCWHFIKMVRHNNMSRFYFFCKSVTVSLFSPVKKHVFFTPNPRKNLSNFKNWLKKMSNFFIEPRSPSYLSDHWAIDHAGWNECRNCYLWHIINCSAYQSGK